MATSDSFPKIIDESLTRKSGVIVISPLLKARSWIAFRQSPLRGFIRCSILIDHGMIWLAFSNSVKLNPVMQHWKSYAARTVLRKKLWFTLVFTVASHSLPSGSCFSFSSNKSSKSPWLFCAKSRSLSKLNLSQSSLYSFQISTSNLLPCSAPEIFLSCKSGSRRAKFANFHDTAEVSSQWDLLNLQHQGSDYAFFQKEFCNTNWRQELVLL